MKKILTLTMILIIALLALSVNVSAVEVLTEAELNAAVTGTDTNIVLGGNIELKKQIKTYDDITLDLNGYTLTGPDDGSANWYAFIIETGTFTLKDSSEEKTGEIYAKCYGIETKKGTLIVESGKITATKNGTVGTAIVNYGGKVEIKDGTFIGTNAALTMQAFFSDAETVITGGSFKATNTEYDNAPVVIGGQYSTNTETVTITNGEFVGVEALKVFTDATVEITGGNYSSDISEYLSEDYEYDSETGNLVCTHANLTKHEEVPATYEANGTKEYYECDNCGAWFEDKETTKQITDKYSIVIAKLVKEEEPKDNTVNNTVVNNTVNNTVENKVENNTVNNAVANNTVVNNTANNTVENKVEDTEEKDDSPKTGATSVFVIITIIAFAGYVLSTKRK